VLRLAEKSLLCPLCFRIVVKIKTPTLDVWIQKTGFIMDVSLFASMNCAGSINFDCYRKSSFAVKNPKNISLNSAAGCVERSDLKSA
jgi:hypothetical protein